MTASELNAILADAGELKVNDGVTLTITEDVTIKLNTAVFPLLATGR